MNEFETFYMEYPGGYMNLNVGMFFGMADKKRINKVLKLARQNCSNFQRAELIQKLKHEADRCTQVLDTLGGLEYRRKTLLYSVLGADYPAIERDMPAPEKAIMRQRDRLKQIAADLEKDNWMGRWTK